MSASNPRIVYVTSSKFKVGENEIFVREATLADGSVVGEHFEFDIREAAIPERLEIRLVELVRAEAASAYASVRVPCIVEHAGLVLDGFGEDADFEFPAGLTKPMWDTLGDRFVSETHSAGRAARAKAVVAYCDGQRVHHFVGETEGTIAESPRGGREFYWDTIFIPNNQDGSPGALTYAEIVDDPSLGLRHKVLFHSQSTRAKLSFLEWFRKQPHPALWPSGFLVH
ncbi:MAG: non-canonical purine NTP pyrophosphatase [Solirubrobacterales bacterium]